MLSLNERTQSRNDVTLDLNADPVGGVPVIIPDWEILRTFRFSELCPECGFCNAVSLQLNQFRCTLGSDHTYCFLRCHSTIGRQPGSVLSWPRQWLLSAMPRVTLRRNMRIMFPGIFIFLWTMGGMLDLQLHLVSRQALFTIPPEARLSRWSGKTWRADTTLVISPGPLSSQRSSQSVWGSSPELRCGGWADLSYLIRNWSK